MYEGIIIQNSGQIVNFQNLQKSVDGEYILYGVSSFKVNLTNGASYNEKVQILDNSSDVKIFLIDANGKEIVIILRGFNRVTS